MLSPGDAVQVCGAPADLPPPPHTLSSDTSSSSSQHGPMALAPHSVWVSAQAFWGAWWVMGSALSFPSPFRCVLATEAKFCFLRSLWSLWLMGRCQVSLALGKAVETCS